MIFKWSQRPEILALRRCNAASNGGEDEVEAVPARGRGGGATSSSPSSCSATSQPPASCALPSGSGGARRPRHRQRPRNRCLRRGRLWCARREAAPWCYPLGSMTRYLLTPGRRRSRWKEKGGGKVPLDPPTEPSTMMRASTCSR
jgi:hypothetical protein